ncbi:hypothetical protein ES705_49506 [subsurface metagenome]
MIIGFLPILSDNDPNTGDESVQKILYTIHITGIIAIVNPASRALKIKKTFEEFPKVNTIFEI